MLSVTSTELAGWIGAFVWPFVRILALISVAPVLGHASIPARVKIGLAALAAIAIAPSLPVPPANAFDHWNALTLLVAQIGIGLALAFSLRIIFAAIEMAGDLIGLQMGLSFATFVDPQNSDQTPLLGSFLGIVATLLFLSIDGHLRMLMAVAESFRLFPVGAPAAMHAPLREIAALGGELFRLALHLALPVLTALLVCNLALGILTRAAPQLNLLSIGFPITLLAGLWWLVQGTPWMMHGMQNALDAWPAFLPVR